MALVSSGFSIVMRCPHCSITTSSLPLIAAAISSDMNKGVGAASPPPPPKRGAEILGGYRPRATRTAASSSCRL